MNDETEQAKQQGKYEEKVNQLEVRYEGNHQDIADYFIDNDSSDIAVSLAGLPV